MMHISLDGFSVLNANCAKFALLHRCVGMHLDLLFLWDLIEKLARL